VISCMLLESQVLKRALIVGVLSPACQLLFLSCGSSNNNGASSSSGLKFRAFISQT